jgi:hypothetical protein
MQMKKYTGIVLAGIAALGLALTATVAEAKGGNKVRERCKVKSSDVGKLDARWEIKKVGTSKERRRFRAQVEADDDSGLLAGALVDVYVSTIVLVDDPNTPELEETPTKEMVLVGQMTLKQDDDEDDDGDKDLEGKLRFDTKPHSSENHPWQPFPANWPTDVAEGTTVEVKTGETWLLSCDL